LSIKIQNGPDLSLLASSKSVELEGPNQPALISNNTINLGIPTKKFSKVYADSFEGNAISSTTSTLADNIKGGGQGSILYQESQDTTKTLAIGAPNTVLAAAANNTLIWKPINSLTPGNFIVGNVYNTSDNLTWNIDASSENLSNKLVARDSNGNFSANSITAALNGNASTATKLQTARTINGVPFDGTANVFVNYTITFGNTVFSTAGFTNQVGSFNDNSNFFDVFPPTGKTMANLVAFIPSIAIIHFAGGVNADDSLRCIWVELSDRIRVRVQNTEQRSTPAANYLAIWS
jgi:hypothetical protein